MSLQGRHIIITGASQGLGLAIAKAVVEAGGHVLLCARNLQPLDDAAQQLQKQASPNQIIRTKQCDVTDEASVDALAAEAISLFPHVDGLINNAGVYGPMGSIEDVDWNEWKQAIEINLFGTVYPCRALIPHFKQRGYGKIVNLSGGGATNPLPRISAYAASKAAVVRVTETFAEELRENHIDVNAVAPGVLNTRLTQQLLDAGPDTVGKGLYAKITQALDKGETTLDIAAELCVYLCSAASDGITGKLIAAPWDPWPFSDEHRSHMHQSDIYTLRRILPKDRGQTWGD